MGRMKEYYMQLIEEGKMRDPNLEMFNDDEYWANRQHWEEQQRFESEKEEENDDN
jgi:hypothetical protein